MSLDFLLKSFSYEDKIQVTTQRASIKPKYDLAGLLQRERMRTKKRSKNIPVGKTFAPSAITYGWCERAKVAQLLGIHTLYYEKAAPKLQLTLDFGNAIHHILQGYMWKAGLLEGEFRCLKCDKTWYAVSPTNCAFVNSHSRRYLEFKEVPIYDTTNFVKGRCDGIIHFPVGAGKKATTLRQLWDVKSIAGRTLETPEQQVCFEDLKDEPKFHHKVQIMLYMPQLEIFDGHIVYVNKNTAQIKSYHVEYDEAVVKPFYTMIAGTIEKAQQIFGGSSNTLPLTCDKKACSCENISLTNYKKLSEVEREELAAVCLNRWEG